MSIKKTVAIAAAAGALTAISVPAMAIEHEFHGLFNFGAIFSNYNTSNSGNIDATSNLAADNIKTNNYFEQRTRLQYIAKASNDLKLVTQFEIDNMWGKSTATTATSNKTNGVGIDTDVVNIEVKHAYLDFNVGSNFNTKVGMLPYKDTLKGIVVDADLPAIATTTKLGAYSLGLGFSRYASTNAGSTTLRNGDLNTDLFIMDNKFEINKDTTAALSYYFLADYSTADTKNNVHTLGLSGATKVGGLDLSGFIAKQFGDARTAAGAKSVNQGWAANLAAKINAGAGTARTGLLFVSGDNDSNAAHNKEWRSTGVQSYNESGLIILTRNTANSPTNTDQYIRRNITNQAVAYFGYDAKLSDKLNLDTGLGFAWVPSSNGAPVDGKIGKANASDFMGTELGLTTGYKLYSNLTLKAQAAYMVLGGYYKHCAGGATTPENPYTMRLMAQYSF